MKKVANRVLGLFFDPEDEAICSSITSADIQSTKPRYVSEDRTLQAALSIMNVIRYGVGFEKFVKRSSEYFKGEKHLLLVLNHV